MKPFLEQAAAAAAATADAAGTAKAQAAAKKAKKLTPEEMKLMRQQADPNFASKKDAPAAKKSKGAKESKAAAAATAKDVAAGATQQTPAKAQSATADAGSKAVQQDAVAVQSTRSASASPAAAGAVSNAEPQSQAKSVSGNKRHHGLGFTEEQPNAKRSKQQTEQSPSLDKPQGSQGALPAATQHDSAAQGKSETAAAATAAQSKGEANNAKQKQQQSGQGHQQPGQGRQQPGQGRQQPGQGRQQQGQGQQQAGQGHAAAAQAGAPDQAPVIFTDECTAFIRGLDSKVTEANLQTLLEPCGDIKDVRIVVDKATSRPKVSCTLCEQYYSTTPLVLGHLLS